MPGIVPVMIIEHYNRSPPVFKGPSPTGRKNFEIQKAKTAMIFSKNDIFGGSSPHADGLTAEEYVRRLERERTDSLENAEIDEPSGANCPTAIAGAGLMGRSIAAAFLRVRLPILLYDTAPDALAAAPNRIADELALQLSGTERPDEAERAEAARRVESLLKTTGNPADLNRADVIIETIIEKLKVKQRFYRSLAPLLTGKKLLLSNTSTIQITDLAEGLAETDALTPEACAQLLRQRIARS